MGQRRSSTAWNGIWEWRTRDGNAPEAEEHSIAPLTAEALAGLPQELRAQLRLAVVSLDSEALALAIQRVSEVDAGLGRALAGYAERLAYTAILKVLGDPA